MMLNPHTREVWAAELIGETGWKVAYRLVPVNGRPVVAELRVLPAGDRFTQPGDSVEGWQVNPVVDEAGQLPQEVIDLVGNGLPRSVLDQVRVTTLFTIWAPAARRWIRAQWTQNRDLYERLGFNFEILDAQPRRQRQHRGENPLLYYARIAETYVLAVEAGYPPVAEVARNHKMSATQAHDLIVRKVRGLYLTAAPGRGRAGGELTQLATDLLSEAGEL